MDPEMFDDFFTRYPQTTRAPIGLPGAIEKAFEAALKVRRIDSNAYGVLIGRLQGRCGSLGRPLASDIGVSVHSPSLSAPC